VSAVFAAFQERLDFIVVAQERNEKIGGSVLEDKTQCNAAAALEQFVSQFANAEAAVNVWPPKTFNQLA